jgi:hypothetical protein
MYVIDFFGWETKGEKDADEYLVVSFDNRNMVSASGIRFA